MAVVGTGIPDDRDARPDSSRTGSPRSAARWMWPVGAAAIAALVRLWLVADRTSYSIGDEARYLAISRTLTGDIDWSTRGLTYQPGFGVLISPIHWFTSDSTIVLRFALFVNVALVGALVIVLVLLGRQITDASIQWCSVAALLAVSAPGVFAQANWAGPEVLLATLFAAILLASMRLVRRPEFWTGLPVVLLAAASYLSHSRHGILVASTFVLLGWLTATRRLGRGAGLGLALLLVVLTLLTKWFADWVIDVTWVTTAENNTVGSITGRLHAVHRIGRAALGMAWYQMVTTLGVAIFGAWAITSSLRRAQAARIIGLEPASSAVILLHAVPIAGISAVFMSGRAGATQHAAHMVYGRYWEAIVPPVLLVGLLLLALGTREIRRRMVVAAWAATAGTGVLMWLIRQNDIDDAILLKEKTGIGRRIVGLVPFNVDSGTLSISEVTLIALLAMAVVYAVVFLPVAEATTRVTVFALLGVAAATGILSVDRYLDAEAEPAESLAIIDEPFDSGIIPPGSEVRFITRGPGAGDAWNRYQSIRSDIEFQPFERETASTADFVFAVTSIEAPRRLGGEVVWIDPIRDVALWDMSAAD